MDRRYYDMGQQDLTGGLAAFGGQADGDLAALEAGLSAFAGDGVLDRDFPLPEIKQGMMFPARQAISFHFVDYVVHSWDVARTLGLRVGLDPALVDAALRVAQAVPGGDARLEPGAAFGPVVDWPGDAGGSRLDQIVALLGRSPDWQPAFVPAETSRRHLAQ